MTNYTWQSIFAQSPANYGHYEEEDLPHINWHWPKETWFQARRSFMREQMKPWSQTPNEYRAEPRIKAP